jgi:hypothetical protein
MMPLRAILTVILAAIAIAVVANAVYRLAPHRIACGVAAQRPAGFAGSGGKLSVPD